ncbi:MAG TPA: ATP-dependent helicase [Anaerolineales bacterium]|jgi:DNA helicase-2/ATP-dependent DNA helicase PcrA|nr:ATP-dependent helicase [Anaerolineales bacterium]
MNTFIPRPSQEQILRYLGGRLGIAAVPGAGKTQILSALAAQIIASGALADDQEVLIVTLVNSAVDNFEARVKRFFDNPLQALYRYRVRTLHGLAHDIVREKPGRVGLDERFGIIDEREADFIRREAVKSWLSVHAESLDDYLDPNMEEHKRDWVRRDQLPEMIANVALAFIRSSKDRRLTPEKLRALLDRQPAPLPLAELGLEIYADYQRALTYRAAVDFDDLIRFALEILESDEEYLERVRYHFPFILEDEAQDSSQLQQSILALLSGPGGNWVRVGDPNQAIFETFTTASPELLRAFIADNPSVDMPESGRSQQSIIDLANNLINWVMNEHPVEEARTALAPPYIEPVPPGDPQPNPENDRSAIHFVTKRLTAEEETKAIVDSVAKWLPRNPDSTVAILVPRNLRGVDVINALKAKNIEYVEFLSSTSNTRAAAGALSNLISYLADPASAPKLAKAYQVWRRAWKGVKERQTLIHDTSAWLRRVGNVEDYVNPNLAFARGEVVAPLALSGGNGGAVAEALLAEGEQEQVVEELNNFRVHVRRWLAAVTLPIDQLVLTLAQDIFTEAADLALAHKLALVLRKAADDHSEWRLPELTAELAVIAKNERRFIGFSADDSGFDPEQHRGKVVVTTMHKAKGLEWDRVYLMSVNNYDFPSNQPNDRFISERWFLRNNLNLEAEALAQLNAATFSSEYDWYEEGAATLASRVDYVKERLRLFYVGITRAKKELIVTWNTGRQGDATPSLAMQALMGWWESEGNRQ